MVTPPAAPTAKPGEIEKVGSIEDAIAVKLGEKVVKPAAPSGDDLDLNKEIDAATATFTSDAKKSWAAKTYELRDAKRKLAAAEAAAVERDALKAKVTELETRSTAPAAEVEALRKQLADTEQEVAAVRLERTVTYKTQIAEPIAAAEAAALQLGVKGEIKEAEVLAAIRDASADRAKKLGDILANLNEFDKVSFVQTVRQIDALKVKATELQANAKQSLEAMIAQEQAVKIAADAKRKADYETAVPEAWSAIGAAVPVLKPVEGNDAWNNGLTNAKEFAKNEFSAFDPKSQVTIMQRAGVFPLLQGTIQHQAAQIAALTADLAKYRQITPGAGGDGTTVSTPAAPVDHSKETLAQSIDRRLREAGITQA